MAATTAPRNTPERGDFYHSEEQEAKTNVIFNNGAMVAQDATGYMVPALTATTLTRSGRVNVAPERKLDMTGLASGSKKVKIEFGCFRWANSAAGDAIVRADVGKDCYIVDDQTVAKTDGTGARSIAGKIVDIEAGGVWVLHVPR